MKSIFVTKHSKDGYALYPDENENGVRLSELDHLELFECLTKIYPEVIHKVSKSLQNKFEISPVVIDAITKHTIIPLLNVFFDITTRIGIAVNVEKDVLNIIKMVNIEPPSSIDEFSFKAKNDEFFNQFLILIKNEDIRLYVKFLIYFQTFKKELKKKNFIEVVGKAHYKNFLIQ